MRNLVLIHLESLSYMNYRINQNLFPILTNLEKNSWSFSRYFSTATSTLMVIGDLSYGGILQYEECSSLNYIPQRYLYNESLFDQLKEKGYKTRLLIYPDGTDHDSGEKRHIVGFKNQMELSEKYENYIDEIEKATPIDCPFVLMVCNYVSNVACNHFILNAEFESGLDRWEKGYQSIDTYVGDLIHLLKTKKLLDKTTIIFYGDHGDDYFEHGSHEGLVHAIEPYANLIHTPFWICDNRLIEKGMCSDLINTTDIRIIIERLLEMTEDNFLWRDLKIPQRTFTLARNAYAAQPVRADSFNKGYSITDGKFLLLVSNYGLELYDIEMDLQCQNNLLNYFIYKQKKLYLNEELNSSLRYHYRYIFNMSTIRKIRQIFYFYRRKLLDEVKELYSYIGDEDKISELNFEEIHYF